MGDKLIMSKKERERKVILTGYQEGRYTLVDAAERMKASYRQAKRIWSRYKKYGDEGLVHRNRGKRSGRAFAQKVKKKVLNLYGKKYDGFGPTFAAEKLAEEDQIKLSDETLRQWLKSEGLWGPHRKRKSYRRYRERRACFGELVQIDGSDHAWFSESAERDCLLDMVDDATGKTLAQMDTGETTFILLSVFKRWIEKYGIPESVYVDLKNVYISPKGLKKSEDDIDVQDSFSIFEQVCQRLNVKIIKAYSAQAKGRVERKHGVFQDRFVKELKLKKIKTIEQANVYLEEEFLDKLNEKFAVLAKDPSDRHRDPKPYGDLNQIFCWEYQRGVRNDWTIQFENQWYQLEKKSSLVIRPRQKITVRKHLDGTISLWHKDKSCTYTHLKNKPEKTFMKKEFRGHSSAAQSEHARKNKHKTPWSIFNPDWLKGKRINNALKQVL